MYEYNKEIKKGWDILLDYLLLFTLLYYTYYLLFFSVTVCEFNLINDPSLRVKLPNKIP